MIPKPVLTGLARRNLEYHAGMSARLVLRHFNSSVSMFGQRVSVVAAV
jgi:hypothetical protein